MPELPEAETVARALDRAVKKRKITKVEIFAPRLRTPLGPLCTAKLEGRSFEGSRRRARYAVADLDDGRTLVFHFGMSGTVRGQAACPTCGSKVAKVVLGGRTSWYCPKCQR